MRPTPLANLAVATAALASLPITALVAEALSRAVPDARIQQVNLTAVDSQRHHGSITWRTHDSDAKRMGAPCDDRPNVLLLGSSITYGSGLDSADSLRPLLAAQLPDYCVQSVAQPAYVFENQHAELQRQLDIAPPDVVVWEVWHNLPNAYTVAGDIALNTGSLARDDSGLPPAPIAVSDTLHHWLMARASLWRRLVVQVAPANPLPTAHKLQHLHDTALGPDLDELVQRGIPVVLWFTPPLDQPFVETTVAKQAAYQALWTDLQEHADVYTIDMAAELAQTGLDHEAARVDQCCHYSALGSQAVATVLANQLRQLQDNQQPASATP